MVQLLGFCGSALIILSITMGSVVRLRIVGLAGALAFVAYGLALPAWPVVVTNLVTSSIHLFHLRKLFLSRAGRHPDRPEQLSSGLIPTE